MDFLLCKQCRTCLGPVAGTHPPDYRGRYPAEEGWLEIEGAWYCKECNPFPELVIIEPRQLDMFDSP